MGQQKIINFPEAGFKYLESSPPKNPNYSTFHKEVIQFIREIIPTPTDIAVRQHIVSIICSRIKELFEPTKEIVIILPCGSCLSGTFLPNGDIDLALLVHPYQSDTNNLMTLIMEKLHDIGTDWNPLPQARVPVLKFTAKPGIHIDISIDELHGPLSVSPVRSIFLKFPCLLPAQILIKTMLYHYKLDSPYSGGISSYVLQIMLLAYIQYGQSDNITDLIVGFFKFYGQEFNFTLTGIDVVGNGRFFSRLKENCLNLESPSTMYIRDPMNPNNILGHNAFKMPQVKELFSKTYLMITRGNGTEFINELRKELPEFKACQRRLEKYANENGIVPV